MMRERNKNAKHFLIKIFSAFTFFFFVSTILAESMVVGYYPSWIKSTLPAENIKFEHLTHINHAFAWPDAAGNLKMYESLIYPKLNQLAHDNNVKVLISLGGAGNSDGFSPVAADTLKRAFFISNIINFIKANNYDGVDMDWEFPGTVNDRNNLTTFIRELREQFDEENENWLITFAVGTSNWKGQWYDYNNLVHNVDWFNAMCYDFHGSWSAHSGHNAPLIQPPGDSDGAVDVGMSYLHLTRGIPKSQLTVGMPFYGKEFNCESLYSPFTGDVTDYLYSQIMPKINAGWSYHWDDISKAPYITNSTNTKLITFDDTVSIRHKCKWILDQEYSGGMIWALGQDLLENSQPLLETIGKHLMKPLSITNSTKEIREFVLNQNYPNPFNAITKISFTLKYAGYTELKIYNLSGQKILTLVDGFRQAGNYNLILDAAALPSGIYFYNIISAGKSKVRSMILVK